MLEHNHPDAPRRARALLRAHTLGVLLADETPTPIRYCVLPDSGALIIDCDRDILDASEHVLMIPEESFAPPLSLMLSLEETGNEALHDRHRAYHDGSPLTHYAVATILGGKLDNSEVVDGDEIQQPNPLGPAISRLGRLLNADRVVLAAICDSLTGAQPEEPTAVGIDPHGFDVRARFGVIRVRFGEPCGDEEAARIVIERLIKDHA
ncbi:MAG: hypothetical protein KC996_08470 [Phycisphaerales bacterium]|nr:hypothetical protein [Phycisphaerales bacterium]